MRKALQFDVAGQRLFGTLHDGGTRQSTDRSPRTGVLLLSFGQQPRSWVGDLGSSIADRLAEQGYPTFRFDMPGLGDSPGDLPVHLEVLWQDILLGSHERPLRDLCEELARRHELEGLVVGGFCGGAVTALYGVNAHSPLLRGLVLLEPEMAMVRTAPPQGSLARTPMSVDGFLESVDLVSRRLRSLTSWKRLFSGKADFSFWLRLWYRLLDYIARKLTNAGLRRCTLPDETNHRMLDSWRLARRMRLPTLVISDGSPNRDKYYRAYGLQPGIAESHSRLQWVDIPGTTHAMLTGGAKGIVSTLIASWVRENFPYEATL